MNKSKLVVVDDSGIERSDWPLKTSRHERIKKDVAANEALQAKGLPDAIDPLNARKSDLVFFCLSDSSQPDTLLNGMLEDVRLGDLDEVGIWTSSTVSFHKKFCAWIGGHLLDQVTSIERWYEVENGGPK